MRVGSQAPAARRSARTVKVETFKTSAICLVERPSSRSAAASSRRTRIRSARDDLEDVAVAHPLLDQKLSFFFFSPPAIALPTGEAAPVVLPHGRGQGERDVAVAVSNSRNLDAR